MICHKCGTQNAEGVKFCRECGTALTESAAPASQSLSTSLQSIVTAAKPAATSIRESLARLGVTFSRQQIIGFVISLVGGMIMARILPFIYPIFDPILTLVFGSGPGAVRDGFNTNMMTLITFFTSFGLSFATMFVTTTLKR